MALPFDEHFPCGKVFCIYGELHSPPGDDDGAVIVLVVPRAAREDIGVHQSSGRMFVSQEFGVGRVRKDLTVYIYDAVFDTDGVARQPDAAFEIPNLLWLLD